ncbi:MAG: prepilin-type N-terminal cleavage/methylation domain-containing protein [Planctomycetales bacterium]
MVKPTSHRRKGSTLLELLTVISVAGILFVAGTLFLHRLLAVERTFTLAARTQILLSRLSERWRQDAHEAEKVEVALAMQGIEAGSVTFRQGDREIVWRKQSGGVTREVRRGTERLAWNEFAFAPVTEMSFAFEPAEKVARLTVNRPWPAAVANAEQRRYEREQPAELRIEGACRSLKP